MIKTRSKIKGGGSKVTDGVMGQGQRLLFGGLKVMGQ